jgi:SAM-dependent methyltransferase
MSVDRDYVLGTHDEETARLGIQHEAWSPIVHECWRRAGVTAGDHIVDVGAAPGFAAFDLARLVGDCGHVTAVERSARFVQAGRETARERGLRNVTFVEADLMADPLPPGEYDAAWCRWVASFVESPVVLVDKIASAVHPGGVAMFHEYVDYASWRFSPALPLVEEYIGCVMASWRAAGGEPDVAATIPPLLAERGFVIEYAEPRVYCVRPGDALWTWIATFIGSNLDRLVDLGACESEWAEAVRVEFGTAQAGGASLMLTPMVLEIVARRRGASRG